MKKRVTSKALPKKKTDGKHLKWDYTIEGESGETFTAYARQSTIMADAFSCGLRWNAPSGDEIHLLRVNGSNHLHPNRIEQTTIPPGICHIHTATERYIQAGLQPEGFAVESGEYIDLEGALQTLGRRCNIQGAPFGEPYSLPLFKP